MRLTNCPLLCPRSTSTSPRVCTPLLYSAHTLARPTLTGQTLPVQPSSDRRPSTADRKSPLYCSIIDRSRFPPVWPASRGCPNGAAASRRRAPGLAGSIDGTRDSSTRRASASLRASASAHFNTSPGGKTPNWSRSWPELPPLSNMVTTALRRSHGLRFKPPSKLGRPVPPPKHPTLSCRIFIRRRFYPFTVNGKRRTVNGYH